METIKKFKSPMDRQIDEQIRIHYTSKLDTGEEYGEKVLLLNSGSEWRGDPVPRAVFARRSDEEGRDTENAQQFEHSDYKSFKFEEIFDCEKYLKSISIYVLLKRLQ